MIPTQPTISRLKYINSVRTITGGKYFSLGFIVPLIGYFHTGTRTEALWCLPASLSGDEGAKPPWQLQIELFASNVNVTWCPYGGGSL